MTIEQMQKEAKEDWLRKKKKSNSLGKNPTMKRKNYGYLRKKNNSGE